MDRLVRLRLRLRLQSRLRGIRPLGKTMAMSNMSLCSSVLPEVVRRPSTITRWYLRGIRPFGKTMTMSNIYTNDFPDPMLNTNMNTDAFSEKVRLRLRRPNTITNANTNLRTFCSFVKSDPTSNMNTNVFPVKHNTSTNTNHFVNKPPKPLMEVMKLMENDLCSITHPNRSLMSLKLMEK